MKQVVNLRVVNNRKVNYEYHILSLTADEPLPKMKPGQFVQMKAEGASDVFLRRPFSIYDVDVPKNMVYILIQQVGEGSKALCNLKNGEFVDTILPLGSNFSVPEKQKGKILLIGGGVGIAPLYYHGKLLKEQGFSVSFLIGARSDKNLFDLDTFASIGEVFTTTEDASHGEKGYVTQHSVLKDSTIDMIYTCGPEPMMKAVVAYAKENDVNCEVSLENMMACGFGVCLCCVVDTIHGNICTCTEGPVFNKEILKW